MNGPRDAFPANVAEHLRDDEIDVWLLDYSRDQRRAPLRRMLAAYTGIAVDKLEFVEGPHGRPSLAATIAPEWGFNWSHSGAHAAIAIGRHMLPGIDLEATRHRARALAIAQRYFHPEEATMLAAMPEALRQAAFLELWTAKEAVLKALGHGLSFGLDRLHVAIEHGRLTLRQLDGDDAGAWQLHRLAVGNGLGAALAWRGAPRTVRLWRLASAA